jgi:peptidyl-prolyl cis-trans isomerase A (cyclophilin A)
MMERSTRLATPGIAFCLGLIAAIMVPPGLAAPPRPAPRAPRAPVKRPPGTYVTLQTSAGAIVIRLLPQEGPQTAANFLGLAEGTKQFREWRPGPNQGKLVKRPFYDGLTFHRILHGFMIQGGDPKGDGTGGPGYTIPDELPPRRPYARGAVLMSHGDRPNSAGSQFLILQSDVREHLPKQYVVFGEVFQGMEVVDRIASAPTQPNRFRPNERSTPVKPVVIEKAVVTRVKG